LTDASMWDAEILGADIGVHVDQLVVDPDNGDLTGARIWLSDDNCIFDVAGVKAGPGCDVVSIDWDIFIFRDYTSPSISHLEMIVECCAVAT
jgi:hypothetical protein